MKKLYATTYVLIALNVIVASVLIHLMPDQVPVHFNAANEPDRLGSKYELLVALLFPLCGVFIVMGSKNAPIGKEQRYAWGAVAFELFVFAWILFFLTKALLYDGAPFPEPDLDASRWAAVIGGSLCVVAGNFMPKADRNPFFGLRTPWSEASPETWRRSQRFGGYAGIAMGMAMIALGLVLPARLVTPTVLLVLLVGFATVVVGSYIVYRQELGK
ncbi:SdpI family protein [Eggerthella guodeyinii]|uniref:SdpI family protein n=1 Tax=Eggerthella guodeyinii TaxID=2690837 RepID=A0A6L7IQL6_9ACTN|nr:SdpI family protein [Eggerthella guodeyinii]QOS69552.1 SdpI family protein [Eggerthella guodeyinii]